MFVMLIAILQAVPLRAVEDKGENAVVREPEEPQLLCTSKMVRPRLGDGIWGHRYLPTICINKPMRSLNLVNRMGGETDGLVMGVVYADSWIPQPCPRAPGPSSAASTPNASCLPAGTSGPTWAP